MGSGTVQYVERVVGCARVRSAQREGGHCCASRKRKGDRKKEVFAKKEIQLLLHVLVPKVPFKICDSTMYCNIRRMAM